MDNRRVLLAVLLSLVVLVVWQVFFLPEPPGSTPPSEPPPAAERVEEGAAGPEPDEPVAAPSSDDTPAETDDSGLDALAELTGGDEATAPASAEPEVDEEPVEEAASEEQVVVETDLYRAVLSNRGAQVVSFTLKEHESRDGGRVDLVRRREGNLYPFALVADGAPSALNDALFTVQRTELDGEPAVLFRYRGPRGRADKLFTFHQQGLFDVAVEVERPRDWSLFLGPGIRNPSEEELENRFERRSAVYEVGDELERIEPKNVVPGDPDKSGRIPVTGLRWVGLEDTYFLKAIIPHDGLRQAVAVPYLLTPAGERSWSFRPLPPEDQLSEEERGLPHDLALLLTPDDDRMDFTAYWGAKKHRRLAAQDYDLERTINLWKYLRPIAVPILWGIVWIHDNLVANYGWAIVLMTVLIKLILFPLTHKSHQSMRKMQELNPQMQAIRSKWRGKLRDKQGKMNLEAQRKMNEEMQALYREAGVNPAGGCLPMLLQMPVLFAFYQLLSAAVELRGAPWIFWINDLSQPDPIYALPIIMGVSQFLQQRLTPMSGDPTQRKIMMMMPVIFTVFFLGFPAGLVLYWLTNNVLTILQTGIFNYLKSDNDEAAPTKRAKASKK